jgi:hypothetical protein
MRKHIHIAPLRVEVVSQHRAKQAQLAYAARAAELRDPLAVNRNGQFGGNFTQAHAQNLAHPCAAVTLKWERLFTGAISDIACGF